MKWTNDRADNVDDRRGSGGGGMLVGGGLGTLKIEKINTTTRFIEKLIAAPQIEDKTMISLGKFNFLNKSPLLTMDTIPILVASEKKDHITFPNNKATGKCGTSPPNRKK
jgi:hypothetical protein